MANTDRCERFQRTLNCCRICIKQQLRLHPAVRQVIGRAGSPRQRQQQISLTAVHRWGRQSHGCRFGKDIERIAELGTNHGNRIETSTTVDFDLCILYVSQGVHVDLARVIRPLLSLFATGSRNTAQ